MNLIKSTFLFIVIYTMQAPLFAKTYNVSDINALHTAVTKVKSGDKIRLSAGEYNLKKRIVLQGKKNITIEGIPYRTIINGSKVKNTTLEKNTEKPANWLGLIHIEASEVIKISGIHLKNSNFAGFHIENSYSITIENSFTDNTYSSGIGVWESQYVYLYDNEVRKACNGGGQEAITIAISKNVEAVGNNVHHNGKRGFKPQGTGGEGIDIKDGSSDVLVSNNRVHHLYGRIGIYVDAWNKETHSIDIYNNDVFNNGNSGIVVASECGAELHDVYIYDNKTHGNAFAGITVAGWSNPEHCGQNMLPEPKPMHNIYIQANDIQNNGYGLCSVGNPVPCKNGVNDEGQSNKGDGGINYGNLFAKNIYIEYNSLEDNKTDAYTSFDEYPQFNFWSHIASIDGKIVPNNSNGIVIQGNSFY
jgi:hypothetical protein